MRFSITQEQPDSPLLFQLLSDDDRVLMTSGTYASRETCTEGIRATINALRDPESFGIQADNSIALRDADGTTLAAGEPLNSRQAATEAIASIVANAAQNSQYDVTLTTATTTTTRRKTQRRAFQRASPAELVALYNFARLSSGTPGFELYQEDNDQLYYFHFNDADGRPMLFGRGFAGASKQNRRVEAVVRNAGIDKRYEIQQDGEQIFFILKARNGQEIARSRTFSNRADAEQAVGYLIGSIPGYADQYIKKRKTRSQSQSNVYNLAHASASGQRGFEPFRNDETKQHYFHYNDDAGLAMLFSQGYSSARSRDNGIRSVIRNAALPERYEAKEHNGKYYFILRAGNRQEIAQSRFFASAAERDQWITFLPGSISGYAGAYGVSLTTTTTSTETESFTLDAPSSSIAAGLASAADAAIPGGDGDASEEVPDAAISDAAISDAVISDATTSDAYGTSEAMEADGVSGEDRQEEEEVYAGAYDDDRSGFRLWLPWIIGLLAVLLILFWLLSMLDGCGGNRATMADEGDGGARQETVSAGPEAASAETPAEMDGTGAAAGSDDSDGANAGSLAATGSGDEKDGVQGEGEISAGAGSTGEPPAKLGPDAIALGFAPGSIEAEIANLLSQPGRALPASFVMDKINFPKHSAKLNKTAYSQVGNLIALMKAYPDLKITFEGHIDGSEDDDIAQTFMKGEIITLSAVRARCLYQRFQEQGIATTQLDFVGRGNSKPLVANDSEQNKQKNRRLEAVISQ